MPTEINKTLAEALKRAIQAEFEGQHFYMMAAQTTKDPKGKEIFELLSREELDHAEYLKSQYESVIKDGQLDPKLALKSRVEFSIANPIFSEEIRGRIKEAHYEMTALAVGIQLELTAKNFYEKCAGEATNPQEKQFFDELASWEAGHYNALLSQQESLKEDYWSDSGFSPF